MSVTRTAYSDSLRFFGETSPAALIAAYGSPLYVYNETILRRCCRDMKDLAAHPGCDVCFSTKANGNPHLLRVIRDEGLLADAMSPNEVALLKKAGFRKEAICYVCNNVSREELAFAAREAAHVSVDSISQLDDFGRLHPGGSVMVRVNPGIGAGHHDKVVTAGKKTKFGVAPEEFDAMRATLRRHNLTLLGLNQHIGSLFMDASSFLEAVQWLLRTAEEFPGISIIDFGGGFGIPYHKYDEEKPLDVKDLSVRFGALLRDWSAANSYAGRFFIEPGRYVSAECGLLLGTAHAVKNNGPTRYVGTDLGFNVLARPVMYDAYHDLEIYPGNDSPRTEMIQTLVGNICESGDILARERALPEIVVGDHIGVLDAGAYGHVMSSNYNQRLRPAEVLIQADGSPRLIRRRDNPEDLLAVYPE